MSPESAFEALQPGDLVALHGAGVGSRTTVEDRTQDGCMIWVRNEFNERKLVHFEDCMRVRVLPSHAPRPESG